MNTSSTSEPRRGGVLEFVERVGNLLPEPALLFALLAGAVIVIAAIGDAAGWAVQPIRPQVETRPMLDSAGAPVLDAKGVARTEPALDAQGRPKVTLAPSGEPIRPRTLLSVDGVYWMFSSMLRNFTGLPALGLIFVAMLGIGLAEKFGFFSALMRWLALTTPRGLLTPVIVLLGANSSVASDAGYIILPPLAAALYHAVGRPPIAGLAAAFAGVAGGFGGGFFPTGGDGVLAGFAQDAARIIDPAYNVTILHNFYFKAGSAVVVMLAGWFVTDRIVEPRLAGGRKDDPSDAQDAKVLAEMALQPAEKRALFASLAVMAGVIGVLMAMIFIPGAPLHGHGQQTLANGRAIVLHEVIIAEEGTNLGLPANDVLAHRPLAIGETPARGALQDPPGERWSHAIVPMILLAFLLPGVAFGWLTGALKTQRDFIDGLHHGIRSIVPVLAIAFFMAQFVNYFAYTRLDRMLAYGGGSLLVQADLPTPLLLVLFVFLVVMGDFAISGMLSKFGVLAPIFIPMFMMVGISPELTTAAYRIGDSVVNIITPLNSYLLIVLAVLQRYKTGAGLGSLISLMLPYSVVLFVAWTGFLLVWWVLGIPLGVQAPLHYEPRPL